MTMARCLLHVLIAIAFAQSVAAAGSTSTSSSRIASASVADSVTDSVAASTSTSTSTTSSSSEPTKALLDGRKLLEKGDLKAAHEAYAKIPYGHPLWSEKVEDLLRFHLLRGSAQEAWRLVQILKRTNVAHAKINDYERLALYKNGSCPLALKADHELHGWLLDAATLRASQFNMRAEAKANPVEGTSLVAGLVPYLAEIPRTDIIKGLGCRFEKATALVKGPARLELEKLDLALASNHWLSASRSTLTSTLTSEQKESAPSTEQDQTSKIEPMARLLITARALQLASEIPDRKAYEKLGARIGSESSIPWVTLPDPERRRLFARFFPGADLPSLPESQRAHAQQIALDILASESTPQAADWLAMVNLELLSPKERRHLLTKVERLGSFKNRGWVLFELARSYQAAGQTSEALTLIRRLLVEGEEKVDDVLERALVELASAVFSEHRFNESLVGAMRSALPPRLWQQLIESASLKAAFGGRARDYQKILQLGRTASGQAWQQELIHAVARRDLGRFRSMLTTSNSSHSQSSQSHSILSVAGKLAADLTARDESEVRELAPYAETLASSLRLRIRKGDARTSEMNDLVQALEDKSQWAKGASSVRRGIVKVGVARMKSPIVVPPVFKLVPPEKLPLRDLIFIPDQIAGRGWVLNTKTY